jgi:hypothetical protein
MLLSKKARKISFLASTVCSPYLILRGLDLKFHPVAGEPDPALALGNLVPQHVHHLHHSNYYKKISSKATAVAKRPKVRQHNSNEK